MALTRVAIGAVLLIVIGMLDAGVHAALLAQTGSIAGQVVDDDGRAIARTLVTASPIGATAGNSQVVSDDQGRFAIPGLPAGRYLLRVVKPGFVETIYGAAGPRSYLKPVVIERGRAVANIRIVVPRGAAISGTVRDLRGNSISNVLVQAVLTLARPGGRRPILEMPGLTNLRATTDDRGVFRLFGLAAGEYVVLAMPQLPGGSVRQITEADVEAALLDRPAPTAQATVGYRATYYPGTTSPDAAAIVAVKAGDDRSGVDVVVEPISLARVSGHVSGMDSVPTAIARLRLEPSDRGGMSGLFRNAYAAPSRPGGGFALDSVAPGRYVLEARLGTDRGGVAGWGRTEVVVDGNNAEVTVPLQAGAVVSGHVVFDGSAPRPDVIHVRIALEPLQEPRDVSQDGSGAMCDRLGSFKLLPVVGGRYRIAASVPAIPGVTGTPWIVRAVLVGGRDTVETGFELGNGIDALDATVVFTDRPAQIGGIVEDTSGDPAADVTVIAFAANRQLWAPQSRRIVAVRSDADGRYQLRGLPGGEYLLAAVTDVERNEWYEPPYLDSLAARATRISIAEGEHRVQFLRIKN